MRLLRERGYTNVRHYPGGLAEWKEAGGPLERGAPPNAGTPEAGAPSNAGVHASGYVRISSPPDPGGERRRSAVLFPGRRTVPRWTNAVLDTVEERSTADLVGLWLAMILGCGLVYWLAGFSEGHRLIANGTPVAVTTRGLATAVYFSFVTATSVGYGDVVPLGALRALAVAEAIAGLLAFGMVVSRFVSRRQDQLVREIHRATFEERLDRVQTNLHLVLAELQTIATLCDGPAVRPERLAVRLESAAMVFAGELRAVHALLYRPEHAPEEAILEAILAGLAAALRTLTEVLTCIPPEVTRSPTLEAACRTMARLAEEICGECVPRAYAPALKEWMDRVRDTARALA